MTNLEFRQNEGSSIFSFSPAGTGDDKVPDDEQSLASFANNDGDDEVPDDEQPSSETYSSPNRIEWCWPLNDLSEEVIQAVMDANLVNPENIDSQNRFYAVFTTETLECFSQILKTRNNFLYRQQELLDSGISDSSDPNRVVKLLSNREELAFNLERINEIESRVKSNINEENLSFLMKIEGLGFKLTACEQEKKNLKAEETLLESAISQELQIENPHKLTDQLIPIKD